jgi:hypothetical protein
VSGKLPDENRNWGEKNLHIRDAKVLADELLADPDVVPLIPEMKALPAEKVAIIGYSYTMDLHWSSPRQRNRSLCLAHVHMTEPTPG